MRLAHHLLRHPSGTFHFRLVVPRDLHVAFGRKIIKQSLRTQNLRIAQMWAYLLSARYAQIFAGLRGKSMGQDEEFEAYLASLKRLEVETPQGYRFKTDGSDRDQGHLIEVLRTLNGSTTGAPSPHFDPSQLPPPVQLVPAETAMQGWLDAIKGETETLPKTHTIKATAVRSFVEHFGQTRPICQALREHVSAWVMALRTTGLATPTLANKAGYVSSFFAWCEAQGYYTAFQRDRDNPAYGVVPYRKKDKRRRAKEEGYVAYTLPEIRQLFDPEARRPPGFE